MKYFFSFLTTFILIFFGANSIAQTTEIFNTPGAGNFTVPCGVTSITVGVYGGGGGGGGSNTNSASGGGGGGGGYAEDTYIVVPGNFFTFTVGAGGAGGIGSPETAASNGGATSWNGGVMISFGGLAGQHDTPGGAGGGGSGSAGGTINLVGNPGLSGGPGFTVGGFGGANNGPLGGIGGLGGAQGVDGAQGPDYGSGGGGGGAKSGGTNPDGGNGANGAIIITYTSTVTPPNAGPDQNGCGINLLAGNTPDAGWTGTWSVTAGTATITTPNSPTSAVSGIPGGTCATLTWTFTQAGCLTLTDDVILCEPVICNDDPCGAIPLGLIPCGSPLVFDNINSTASTGMPEPGCGTWLDNDVWFSAVIPASGALSFVLGDAPGGIAMTMGMAFYDGPCGNLLHSGCDEANGVGANIAMTYMGTPGTTIYIRVWEYYENEGSFDICSFGGSNVSDIVPGANSVTCGTPMTFTDPGGNGNYQNNSSGVYEICPDTPGEYVTLDFTGGSNFFSTQANLDYLTILDGVGTDGLLIGQYDGLTSPGIITSGAPDGCLTVVFQSNFWGTAAGWEASVTCSAVAGVNDTICSPTNCPGGCGLWICATGVYPLENNGTGVEDLTLSTQGCFSSQGEIAANWIYFTALTTGTVEMAFAGPGGQDYNFAVYGPSTDGVPPCPLTTGEGPVICSQADVASYSIGGLTGMNDALGGGEQFEGFEGDGWVDALDVVAGETYAMVINIFQNGGPQPVMDLTIGGTGQLDCTPVNLPVELVSFNGINQGTQNLLHWIVASELNNDYYTVERSVNGFEWEIVGKVDGAGTTQHSRYYELIDYNPFYPITYYRLKQTDFDGNFKYHSVISVSGDIDYDGDFISEMFPNPANSYVTFTYAGKKHEELTVQIVNELGRVVSENIYSDVYEGMPSTIRIDNLSNGMYHVRFTQGNRQEVKKLSIIK